MRSEKPLARKWTMVQAGNVIELRLSPKNFFTQREDIHVKGRKKEITKVNQRSIKQINVDIIAKIRRLWEIYSRRWWLHSMSEKIDLINIHVQYLDE